MLCVMTDSLPNAVTSRYGNVCALETVGHGRMCRVTSIPVEAGNACDISVAFTVESMYVPQSQHLHRFFKSLSPAAASGVIAHHVVSNNSICVS
jgi:hypothetical protein